MEASVLSFRGFLRSYDGSSEAADEDPGTSAEYFCSSGTSFLERRVQYHLFDAAARCGSSFSRALPRCFAWCGRAAFFLRRKEEQCLSIGRVIPHYHGPNDDHSRSIVGAWHLVKLVPPVESNSKGMDLPASTGDLSSLSVSMYVSVIWEEDYEWFKAKLLSIRVPFVSLLYDDGEYHVHDFRSTAWRLDLVDEAVSGCSQYVCVSK